MIKIQEVVKGENYYTITFTEGVDAYGILITLVPELPMYMEFLRIEGKDNVVVITEEEKPGEFKLLKEKYFDEIMRYIKENGN